MDGADCVHGWRPSIAAGKGAGQLWRVPLIPSPRRELLLEGATDQQLDNALRAGSTRALFRGVHVDAASAVGRLARLRAAALTQAPTSVVAMQTAAALLKLRWLPDAWSEPDAVVHFAIDPADTRRHRDGIRLHRRTVTAEDKVFIDGLACMSVTRTLVEMARDSALPALLVVQIIDGALRDKRTTQDELRDCLGRFPGERGVARARRLVGRARVGVDSPQETKMRLMLEDGGIDGLDVNIQIHDDRGDLLARGDLGIRLLLIWGEYDGFVPHTERDTFRNDRPRGRWLQRRGWHFMPHADADLARPVYTCQEWLAAIADAPARIKAMNPNRSPEVAAARQALGFD